MRPLGRLYVRCFGAVHCDQILSACQLGTTSCCPVRCHASKMGQCCQMSDLHMFYEGPATCPAGGQTGDLESIWSSPSSPRHWPVHLHPGLTCVFEAWAAVLPRSVHGWAVFQFRDPLPAGSATMYLDSCLLLRSARSDQFTQDKEATLRHIIESFRLREALELTGS